MRKSFSSLSTPLIADACVRLKVELRAAPPGIRPVVPGSKVAGRVLPAHHRGSVDIFLEAMRNSSRGDVLVIDNDGRTDEACIGDLTVLEANAWGLAGLVVRGLHRDTQELIPIGLPVFSYGAAPGGPTRLDRRLGDDLAMASWGAYVVGPADAAFGDDDGVVFVPLARSEQVLMEAESIWKVERAQADRIRGGMKLSEQIDFEGYLARRKSDPGYTLRMHLKRLGRAIEE